MIGKAIVSDISIGRITSRGIFSALKHSFGENDVVYTVYSPDSQGFLLLPDKERYIAEFRERLLALDFDVLLLDDSVSLNKVPKNMVFFITDKANEEKIRAFFDKVIPQFKDSLVIEKVF